MFSSYSCFHCSRHLLVDHCCCGGFSSERMAVSLSPRECLSCTYTGPLSLLTCLAQRSDVAAVCLCLELYISHQGLIVIPNRERERQGTGMDIPKHCTFSGAHITCYRWPTLSDYDDCLKLAFEKQLLDWERRLCSVSLAKESGMLLNCHINTSTTVCCTHCICKVHISLARTIMIKLHS